jgi:hypothetical protein
MEKKLYQKRYANKLRQLINLSYSIYDHITKNILKLTTNEMVLHGSKIY